MESYFSVYIILSSFKIRIQWFGDKIGKQAGAELGQAQPQLGFWELISFSFKVEN